MSTRRQPSFLKFIPGSDSGDQFGGASGTDGSGIPTRAPSNFMFATGIECSNPTIDNGRTRRDQLAECGHLQHWKEDFALVKDLGLKVLRYGLSYHAVNRRHGKYDWEFADQVMAEIKRLKITPILDLLHFGVPDWIGDFQNPELPVLFAEYAEAVAKRYPWVRYFTPVNEIYVSAKMSAKSGLWNEQLKTDRAFVTAIKHLVAASTLANHRIARQRPDCVIIQSESAEYTHQGFATESPDIRLWNKLRFLALDLLYAHPPDAEICSFLFDNGMKPEEYEWKMRGEPPGYQVMGIDYYGHNEKIALSDETLVTAEDVMGWYQIARKSYERYKKPVMHTETNFPDPGKAPAWLWKQWINVLRMRDSGVPVLGFTWYSLTDQIDWDVALAKKAGTVNPSGLYDLNRRPRPVAKAFNDLVKNFGQITIVPHGEMFEVTKRAAMLKIEV